MKHEMNNISNMKQGYHRPHERLLIVICNMFTKKRIKLNKKLKTKTTK